MNKSVIVVLFLFCAVTFASAQIEGSAGATQQRPSVPIGYSESKPYRPREFAAPKNSPPKKEKKKKPKKNAPVGDETPILETPTAMMSSITDEIITIPVSVFDEKSQFVNNLGQTDFKIFAGGDEQEIVSVTRRDEPVNMILLVDTSPSTAFNIEQIQNYAQAIVGQLKPADKVMGESAFFVSLLGSVDILV